MHHVKSCLSNIRVQKDQRRTSTPSLPSVVDKQCTIAHNKITSLLSQQQLWPEDVFYTIWINKSLKVCIFCASLVTYVQELPYFFISINCYCYYTCDNERMYNLVILTTKTTTKRQQQWRFEPSFSVFSHMCNIFCHHYNKYWLSAQGPKLYLMVASHEFSGPTRPTSS